MKKVLIIVGTRPEAIKLIPVYKEFKRKKNWETLLISTGQHREMLSSIFSFFDVQPDHDMQIMTFNQSLDKMTALLLEKCMEVIKTFTPNLIVVQGDTTSAMCAALAGFYSKTPIAHVEAGLRSYDIQAPFPEEVNRRLISLVANFHFAPTKTAAAVLKHERVPGKIFIVGNTVIDSLLFAKKKNRTQKKYFLNHYDNVLKGYGQMVLITGHRRESFGDGFENICKAIRTLSEIYPKTSFVYPVHLNPNVKDLVFRLLGGIPNVYLIEPVPYNHMTFLMMECKIILTDSGGIQEEAPTLGKPVVIMREKTERPEGVKAGCSVLAGTSAKRIVSLTKRILDNPQLYNRMSKSVNPYGQGTSAKKIAKYLKLL